MIVRHAFNPPHNQRLANLCGPLDEHLSAIGMSLGVRIGHRGEHFRIEGPKKAAERALDILQALYELAGRPIAPDTVQLMLAGDGAPLAEGSDGALVLHTQRGSLKARTPGQTVYLENIAGHDITFG
ncbi:MAG: PhoH family protein, partial [Ottowia sp.]|nr:PhoH family protein [Ottowia sp.]MCB2069706.1 PhoH family protein [Ottowia sp.]